MATTSTPASAPLPAATKFSAPANTAKPARTPKTTQGASNPASMASATAANAVKTAAKPASNKVPAVKKATIAKPAKAVTTVAAKEVKSKKPKLVRDSFTIPKDEYAVIEALKQRASALAQPVKKSELLRAGLKVLATLSDSALRTALQAVPSIKTGRPKAEAADAPKPAIPKAPAKSARK